MTESLTRIVPACFANTETQAFLLASLCFIGTWVMVTTLIQFVMSMIWPFLMIGAVLTLAPHWFNGFITEVVPQYMQVLQGSFKKMVKYVNAKKTKHS